jgi:hypothetical protein
MRMSHSRWLCYHGTFETDLEKIEQRIYRKRLFRGGRVATFRGRLYGLGSGRSGRWWGNACSGVMGSSAAKQGGGGTGGNIKSRNR